MITRTQSRAIVKVHSHVSGEVDLSYDVTEIVTNKSIKGVGSFSLTLQPRRNYVNVIFPNDIVNIYLDPGDGERGFIRTMLGYIDRVELAMSVANQETGATSTVFYVTGSDFTKAIDRTDIYFNPQMEGRSDLLDSDLGSSNLGGHALRTKGITAHGTPADMIENLLELLLGFGAQWTLPDSYPRASIRDNRNQRLQRALARIPKFFSNSLASLGVDIGRDVSAKTTLRKILAGIRDPEIVKDRDGNPIKNKELADFFESNSSLLTATFLAQTQDDIPSILDLLNLSFIEAMSIDGYISSSAIWDKQGSLLSMMNDFSNGIVNELCFDLRPVAKGDDDCFGNSEFPNYSKEPDELGINVDGIKGDPRLAGSVAAVKYVPAVVFREYPYSVVEGLDLNEFFILGKESAGFVPFGPVFAKKTSAGFLKGEELTPGNRIGRVVYSYDEESGVDSISLEPCIYTKASRPLKHLDSVSIVTKGDVISAQIGRSDNDTFNFFSLYANNLILADIKYDIKDFMPILNQVSISRNGLRVFLPQTNFANYSNDLSCREDVLDVGESSEIDSTRIRKNLIRWALLLDHWNQHNIEYLSGTLTLRGMPEIRVGYRLDWLDRHESYYVEQVSHHWKYLDSIITTVQVSRGQRSDPYPAYIPPTVNSPNIGAKVVNENVSKTSDDKDAQDFSESDSAASINPSIGFISPTNDTVPVVTPNGFWEASRDKGVRPHHGLDFKAAKGDSIKAVAAGAILQFGYQDGAVIQQASNSVAQNNKFKGRGGLVVKIQHTGGVVTAYMHLDSFRDDLTIGKAIAAGEEIGKAGASGSATANGGHGEEQPHLHFEVRVAGNTKVDPGPWFTNSPENSNTSQAKAVTTKKSTAKIIPSENKIVKLGGGNRSVSGRLARYFPIRDSRATSHSVGSKPSLASTQQENSADTQGSLTQVKPPKRIGAFVLAYSGKSRNK